MSQRRVVLHIEELVLRGFERVDPHAVAAAVERELTLALAQNPAHRQGNSSVPCLAAPALRLPVHSAAPDIGSAIAQSLGQAVFGAAPAPRS